MNPISSTILRSRQCVGMMCGCVLLFAQPRVVFAYVLAAREGIELKGNGIETDSYDSRTNVFSTGGLYDPAKRKAGGDLVASVYTNSVVNVGNAAVAGHLVVGPAASLQIGQKGTVGDLAWTTNMTGIQPGRLHTDMYFDLFLEDIPNWAWITVDSLSPFGAGGGGIVGGTNYDHVFTVTGDYLVADNGTIYVGTNSVVHLRADPASFGPERIFVAAGSFGTRLTIWVAGSSASLSANYIVQSGSPKDLVFRGPPTCTNITFKGDGNFVGRVWAPDADIQFVSGRGDPMNFTGQVVAKNISVKGHYHFHGDEAFDAHYLTLDDEADAVVGETVRFFSWMWGIPYRCHWQFEGADILGATDRTLTLTNVQLSDAGIYTSVSTTPSSSFTNELALLRVFASGAATLTSPTRIGDQFQFKALGVARHRYRVEASTNLTEWNAVATNYSPFTFADTNATALPRRFYRAVYLPY